MKGHILGFDGMSGIINGEDRTRYSLTIADWKGERPPQVGAAVDFVADNGAARDIYGVGSTLGAGIDVSQIAESPIVQRIKVLLTQTLAAPLALLLLIACLLPAIGSPVSSASLFGIGDATATLYFDGGPAKRLANDRQRLAQLKESEASLTTYLSEVSLRKPPIYENAMVQSYQVDAARQNLVRVKDQRSSLERDIGNESIAVAIETLLPLRYLAPLSALGLLWLCWTGASLRLPSIGCGIATIFVFVLIYTFKRYLGVGIGFDPALNSRIQSVVSLGFGAWLLLGCGIGLLLSGLGKIRNPLAQQAQ